MSSLKISRSKLGFTVNLVLLAGWAIAQNKSNWVVNLRRRVRLRRAPTFSVRYR
jgi:hypothetical protein